MSVFNNALLHLLSFPLDFRSQKAKKKPTWKKTTRFSSTSAYLLSGRPGFAGPLSIQSSVSQSETSCRLPRLW